MTLLWVKALHIIFMVAWFAGIFYLPRLFVYHAQTDSAEVSAQLKVMERRLLYFITPFAVLTLVFGVWLIIAYGSAWFSASGWMHIKLLWLPFCMRIICIVSSYWLISSMTAIAAVINSIVSLTRSRSSLCSLSYCWQYSSHFDG